ncbi:MAG: MFS transporter, partial [Marmoricola sp.]
MAVAVEAPVRVRRGHAAGFALSLGALLAMMAGASAPSPFYPVLEREIGFSPATLTGIFAVYAVALLLTLLVTGSLSDHLGRRPVVTGAFALLALSMLVFWHADSVALLVLARIVQGVASGLLLSSLTAAVVDLEP